MGHRITGIIGRAEVLQPFAERHGLTLAAPLKVIFHFLPLDEDDLERLVSNPGRYVDGWTYLSEGLMSVLVVLSREFEVLYIETEYFGGLGGQSAILYRAGERLYGPRNGGSGPISRYVRPINEALRLAGIVVSPGNIDAFAEVGLGRYRRNEDWKAAAVRAQY
jgi:hypothetical protein